MPHEQLHAMNTLMEPVLADKKVVSMLSILYDSESGAFRYASAGHTAGLLLGRSDQQVVQLTGEGAPLGVSRESEYASLEGSLEVNDIIFMCTDGFPEALNRDKERYGYERPAQVLMDSDPKLSAKETLDLVIADFDEFLDGRMLKDDMTCLLVKRTS